MRCLSVLVVFFRSRNSSARSGTGSSEKFSPNTTQNSIMYWQPRNSDAKKILNYLENN